jgi:hypothetical protein
VHEDAPRRPAPAGSPGYPLRSIARLIASGATGRQREQRELEAMLRLVRAMAGLAAAVGDLRDAQHRLHQGEAARAAATHLTTYRPPSTAPGSAATAIPMARPHTVPTLPTWARLSGPGR